MTDKQLARVLDWVNRVRKEKKIGPPLKRLKKGTPAKCTLCPLGNSLRGRKAWVRIDALGISWSGGAALDSVPLYIVEFMEDVDAGNVPELEKR